MHSSRMRTARALTIFPGSLPSGCPISDLGGVFVGGGGGGGGELPSVLGGEGSAFWSGWWVGLPSDLRRVCPLIWRGSALSGQENRTNSVLLTGLEFNCTVRDFLCPSHLIPIDLNVIQNWVQFLVMDLMGDLGQARGMRAPLGTQILSISCSKIWQNHMLASPPPPRELAPTGVILDPPLGGGGGSALMHLIY